MNVLSSVCITCKISSNWGCEFCLCISAWQWSSCLEW